ncbi:DNA gyrase inhibitor YacG [soil metagenome]
MVTRVRCPTCDTAVEWTAASKFRPFCSDRCKQIDLGAWASDAYTIPGAAEQDDSRLDDGEADH